MKSVKKAFTIVELVIVIAVIAILAAVLIPTFSGIINKAHAANDIQLVKNLNTAVSLELNEQGNANGKYPTAYDAVVVCEKYGYRVDTIVATSTYDIAWCRDTGKFVLIDTETDTVIYPQAEENKTSVLTTDDERVDYFIFRGDVPEGNEAKYSIFAGVGWDTTEVTLDGIGFDAGFYTKMTKVKYINTTQIGDDKDVLIRTNTFGTKVEVDGYVSPNDKTKGDVVTHYGFAGLVDVISVANASYDEYGVVGRLSATSEEATGHIDIKEGARVYQIEQLGGDKTSVSVDANATVYDINHEKVEGAVDNTTERFTEQAVVDEESVDGDPDGERITAHNCEHHYTEDVVDGQHVYEVCKTCGYTLIKVDGVKKTVSTENEEEQKVENVIIPKAAYDGSQVTASSADNGEVQINIDSTTGDYVEPSIEKTPDIENKNIDVTCDHTWVEHLVEADCNNEGSRTTTCSKCGSSYSTKIAKSTHKQFNEETGRLYYNCPNCNAEFGTKELPYLLSKPEHFEALIKLRDYPGYAGYYQVYRADSNGNTQQLYVELTNNLDCSTIEMPTGYSDCYKLNLCGNDYCISGINASYLFNAPNYGVHFQDLTFKDCAFTYGVFCSSEYSGDDVYCTNVTFDNVDITYYGGIFGYRFYGDISLDNCTFKNIDLSGDYAYLFTYDMYGDLNLSNSKIDNCNYYESGIYRAIGDIIIDDCSVSNSKFYSGIVEYIYNDLTITDTKISNCEGAIAVGYGTKAGYTSKVSLTNVDIIDCEMCDAGYFMYCEVSNQYQINSTLLFKDCDVIRTKITGGKSNGLGAFVDNSSGIKTTIENCSIQSSNIISFENSAAAFIGQQGEVTFKNCSVDSNSFIKNTHANGSVSTYAGNGGTYTGNGNTFDGTLVCTKQTNTASNGFSDVKFEIFEIKPINLSAADFNVAEDGTITYLGTEDVVTFKVAQMMNVDGLKNGAFSAGGYPWGIGSTLVAKNVKTNDSLGKLLIIKDVRNLVDDIDMDNVGYSTTDSSIITNTDWADTYYGRYVKNNTLIQDATRYASGTSYVIAGTSGDAEPTQFTVTVQVKAYDDSGATVGSTSWSYTVTPTKVK